MEPYSKSKNLAQFLRYEHCNENTEFYRDVETL